METIRQDLNHAVRIVRKNWGVSAVVTLTLALGIGANTAIFSVVNSVLLKPLPYADPDRLVLLNTTSTSFGPGLWPMSQPNLVDFREQQDVLEAIVVTRAVTLNLMNGDSTERYDGARVSPNLLRVFGLTPFLGRDFTVDEDRPGTAPTVMLGYGLWQRRFGSRAEILGETLNLDGESYTVVGILPSGLRYPGESTDFWIPFVVAPGEKNRGAYFLRAIGRLKKGVSLAEADAQMKAIALRLEKQYPLDNLGTGLELLPLRDVLVGDVRRTLWVLFGAVASVLFLACVNIANLMLARAASRDSEFALRSALGGGRRRLVRQLLTESILLSGIGGALGLALAALGVPALTSISQGSIPRAAEIDIDTSVLLFTLSLSLLTGVAFGLVPALRLSRSALTGALQEGARKGATRGRGYRRTLETLVVAQVGLTMMLLIGTGLILRSYLRLQDVSPGFQKEGLLTFEVSTSSKKYPGIAEQAEFHERVLEHVRNAPGVESVAVVHRLPIFTTGAASTGFLIEGRPVPTDAPGPSADFRVVSPGFFQTMKIPLLKGRDFTEHDASDAPNVVVISEAVAAQHWPGEDPVGKRVQIGAIRDRWWEIVGVVGNVKTRALDKDTPQNIYWTMKQNMFSNALRSAYLVVRPKGDPRTLAGTVRRAVRAIDPEQGLAKARSMEEVISGSMSQRRLNVLLMLVFAAIAFTLVTVGLYGVTSYVVAERTQEIGIRMVLGAAPAETMRLVAVRAMTLVVMGLGAGLAGALTLTRVIQKLLFGVPATDPGTFVTVAALLTVVAAAAIYLPARRAIQLDPLIALRSE